MTSLKCDVINVSSLKRDVIIETVGHLPYKFIWNPLNHWINQSEVQENIKKYVVIYKCILEQSEGITNGM